MFSINLVVYKKINKLIQRYQYLKCEYPNAFFFFIGFDVDDHSDRHDWMSRTANSYLIWYIRKTVKLLYNFYKLSRVVTLFLVLVVALQ